MAARVEGPVLRAKKERSKLLRFFGLRWGAVTELLPGRTTKLVLLGLASPFALYSYDRYEAAKIMQEYKDRVQHLADIPLDEATDELEYPRKIWIMSTRVPDDTEDDRGNRWFKTYIKVRGETLCSPHQADIRVLQPVLYAAGFDYSFLNGTVPGALGRRVRERIRLERIASLTPQAAVHAGEAGYLETLDKRRHAKAMGLTVLVGRNTMKEYFWGMKQGWLVDFDAVEEERGDEGKLNDLKEELNRDGVFDEIASPTLDAGATDQEEPFKPEPTASPFTAPYSSLRSFSPTIPKPAAVHPSEEQRSLIIPAVASIPPQPPFLILPFDHPLGYLRYWPLKMAKYLFLERYRVREGCETALSIIQAVQPAPAHQASFGFSDGLQTGVRQIVPPRNVNDVNLDERELEAKLEDVLTENSKKVQPQWRGSELPESGSPDLDFDAPAEYHYRKTFSETPINIASNKKLFYKELPNKLKIARELENRDRLPTKDEQKYPPPTEDDLKQERLNKEKKWRNDYYGWLMTRVGSKVTWDSRFDGFRVLDLQLAKQARDKYGFVGDRQRQQQTGVSEFA